MSKTKSQTLNELFKEYNLVYDEENKKESDVFVTKNYKIITRTGVEKIQAKLGITGKYEVVFCDPFAVALKGTFAYGDDVTETFGEASVDRVQVVLESNSVSREINKDGNIQNDAKSASEGVTYTLVKGNVQQQPAYLFAMAEKRALSRGVLKLAGLYAHGIYSEDESDDFSKEIRKQRSL